MSIHTVSTRGTLRTNEDQHFVHLNTDKSHSTYNSEKAHANIYCICDGHGGKEVADFSCMRMYQFLTRPGIKYPLACKLVKKIFNTIQQQLIDHRDRIASHCGSTCLCVVQYEFNSDSMLQIYNLGDCRAVVCNNGIGIPLTKDHKPNWPDERRRITKIGNSDIYYDKRGQCWRINDLSVSRSFGDLDNTPYVTHVPDVFDYKLTEMDDFLIIACDGLWDVMDNQTAVNFVIDNKDTGMGPDVYTNASEISQSSGNVAQMLSDYALAKGSTDNISIVIVFFK